MFLRLTEEPKDPFACLKVYLSRSVRGLSKLDDWVRNLWLTRDHRPYQLAHGLVVRKVCLLQIPESSGVSGGCLVQVPLVRVGREHREW